MSHIRPRSGHPDDDIDREGACAMTTTMPEKLTELTARLAYPEDMFALLQQGVNPIYKAAHSGGVPATTLELVHLRASQINGCSACVFSGVTAGLRGGETPERLATVSAWYESPFFSPAERAALALAEAMTRQADGPSKVTDDLWAELGTHYEERQLSALIIWIAMTNFFNRLNGATREPAGRTW
jgi:AhpD family alkylhydroperoxidase